MKRGPAYSGRLHCFISMEEPKTYLAEKIDFEPVVGDVDLPEQVEVDENLILADMVDWRQEKERRDREAIITAKVGVTLVTPTIMKTPKVSEEKPSFVKKVLSMFTNRRNDFPNDNYEK